MKKEMITAIIAAMTVASVATPVFAATPKTDTISKAQAKEIALVNAGLKAEDVTFTKVKLETDDGILQYEVDFNKGNYEYDYDIDAKTGAVIDSDMDFEDDLVVVKKATTKKNTTAKKTKKAKKDKISKEKALDIALKDAGFTKDDISYSVVEQDYEDGRQVYEVEFQKGQKEYTYDIGIKSGKIFDRDVDIDD